MNAAQKLLLYGVGLVIALGLGLAAGAAVDPIGLSVPDEQPSHDSGNPHE